MAEPVPSPHVCCAACGAVWRVEEAEFYAVGETWAATCPATALETAGLGEGYCARRFQETVRAVNGSVAVRPLGRAEWAQRFAK